jgi:DNA-binding response OmpR family regulator
MAHLEGTMKILVVEDEPKAGDYLVKGLQESGYVADLARNGVDGLALALELDYELIVLDVMLPQMDGWAVLARLRERKQTPVLFLTARDDVADRVKGLELGADDYLVKPFSARELSARIEVLRLRQRMRVVEGAAARRLQSVFSQAPVAICILNGPTHVFEQANDYYQRLVGPRPLLGLTIRQAFPELASQGIYELLDGVLASGQPYVAARCS